MMFIAGKRDWGLNAVGGSGARGWSGVVDQMFPSLRSFVCFAHSAGGPVEV